MAARTKKDFLRYPKEALHDTTDYLRIDLYRYLDIQEYRGFGPGELLPSKESTGRAFLPTVFQPQNYKTLEGSIILPMPSNIQDGNSVDYSDSSLDGLTAQVYSAIQSGNVKPNYGSVSLQEASEALGKIMARTGKVVTSAEGLGIFNKSLAAQASNIPFGGNLTVGQILARESGQILNPNMELLFNGVKLRSFKFSFKMTPRDEDEAKEIRKIITVLKQDMSPNIGENNLFLQTPSLFQLSYRKGNNLHPYLNLFKLCFLTDMSVNYTGEGLYATYSDGSPISYIMDLSFKEIEPIYKNDYSDTRGTAFERDNVGF